MLCFHFIKKIHKNKKRKRIKNISLLYEHYKNKDQKIPSCYEGMFIDNCFYCFRYAVEIIHGRLPDKLHNFMLLKYCEFQSMLYKENYKHVISKEFFWVNEYFNFLTRPQDYSKVYLRYIFNKIPHDEHGSNVFEYMASGEYSYNFISFNLLNKLNSCDGLIYWFRRNLRWLLKSMKI